MIHQQVETQDVLNRLTTIVQVFAERNRVALTFIPRCAH